MDGKTILNNGFGSPGSTARVLTNKFLKQKAKKQDNLTVCRKILAFRAITYKFMGKNILNKSFRERILEKSNGELPFIIMADIFVTNRSRGEIYINALIQNLSIVVEVVLENYNSLVSFGDQVIDQSLFEEKVREFIYSELRS